MTTEGRKILQVIDTLDIGGAEKVFIDMCNILYENNENVSALFILTSGVLKKYMNPEVPFIELKRKSKWSLKTMYKCSLVLKKFNIVHCHSSHVYRYIKLISILFFLKRTKVIFQNHYGIININRKPPLFFNSFLKPDYYIGVSSVLVEWSINELKIKEKNSFLLENIAVKEKIEDSIKRVEKWDLILVSNIKENKNQLFALQIAEKMNLSLLLIGKTQDYNYHNLLVESVGSNSAEIKFEQNIDKVQSVLGKARIGLHTSFYETGPLVLIEYLAQGLPFLAYETGEVAKILKPYFPAYFIDNFDMRQWEERIMTILSQTTDIVKMNEVFEKHFGKEQYFKKLKTIYQCIKN